MGTKKEPPIPRRPLRLNTPRYAVCCSVLNLLSQVGACSEGSALPVGYRIPAEETAPVYLGVGSKPDSAITNTAGSNVLYHGFRERASPPNPGGTLRRRSEMAARPDPWRNPLATRSRPGLSWGSAPNPAGGNRHGALLASLRMVWFYPQAAMKPSAPTSQLANEQTRRSAGRFASQVCYRAVIPPSRATDPQRRAIQSASDQANRASPIRPNCESHPADGGAMPCVGCGQRYESWRQAAQRSVRPAACQLNGLVL
jgi:hypothetical protein